jgi:hypothetical protein
MSAPREKYTNAEIALVITIIVVVVSFLGLFFEASAERTQATVKEVQLRLLGDTIAMYHIQHGTYPKNVSAIRGWCMVGLSYTNGTCLNELVEQGYYQELPSSLEDSPLLYQYTKNGVYVAIASSLPKESIPDHQRCYGNRGELLLCHRIQ